jgi:hypothetical protein
MPARMGCEMISKKIAVMGSKELHWNGFDVFQFQAVM